MTSLKKKNVKMLKLNDMELVQMEYWEIEILES